MIVDIPDNLIPYNEEDYSEDGYYYDDNIPQKYQKLDPDIDLNNYNENEKYEFNKFYSNYEKIIEKKMWQEYEFNLDYKIIY